VLCPIAAPVARDELATDALAGAAKNMLATMALVASNATVPGLQICFMLSCLRDAPVELTASG